MKRIELGLHEHHAALSQQVSTQSAEHQQQEPPRRGDGQADSTLETPFARVNSVADGSPANIASLRPGDQIRSLGGVNWMNHDNLTKVAEVVQRNEGVSQASNSPYLLTDLGRIRYLLTFSDRTKTIILAGN